MSLHKKALECGITPSCQTENRTLFHSILKGNQAKTRLVEGNMAYVVATVETFLDAHSDFAYLKDDLISEGFLVLARVADTLSEVHTDDFFPQGLMARSLRNAFLNMIRVEREVPLTDAISNNLMCDMMPAINLKLDILDCCRTDIDREIIRLRCDGLIDKRIGRLLGLSERHVGRLRAEILARFQEMQED